MRLLRMGCKSGGTIHRSISRHIYRISDFILSDKDGPGSIKRARRFCIGTSAMLFRRRASIGKPSYSDTRKLVIWVPIWAKVVTMSSGLDSSKYLVVSDAQPCSMEELPAITSTV